MIHLYNAAAARNRHRAAGPALAERTAILAANGYEDGARNDARLPSAKPLLPEEREESLEFPVASAAVSKHAKKRPKKRLHKRWSAHYKCAHEHPTPQYFTRGAGRTRLDELAATRGNCARFLASARHASRAGR